MSRNCQQIVERLLGRVDRPPKTAKVLTIQDFFGAVILGFVREIVPLNV